MKAKKAQGQSFWIIIMIIIAIAVAVVLLTMFFDFGGKIKTSFGDSIELTKVCDEGQTKCGTGQIECASDRDCTMECIGGNWDFTSHCGSGETCSINARAKAECA